MTALQIGIIGSGQIGVKRAREVARHPYTRLVAVADTNGERAQALASAHGCKATGDWQELASDKDVDVIIVATTHNWLAPITLRALESGKHVLCEKPLASNAQEAQPLVEAAQRRGVKLKAGFNHRHHPAIWNAHSLAQSGEIGRLMYSRCRYGHGSRAGYDREWRADPLLGGGGALLDQGAHALDLFSWFLGEITEVNAVLTTMFWDTPVEDNAFCLLRTASGQVASLHASWTQWRNIFSFELFGELGYIIAEGLGGNYGPERLVIGRRPPEFGKPEERSIEYNGEDTSWREEWQEFISAIQENRDPLASGQDAWGVLKLIEAARQSSEQKRTICLH